MTSKRTSSKLLPVVVSASLAFGMCPAVASAADSGEGGNDAVFPSIPSIQATDPDSIAIEAAALEGLTIVEGGAEATYSEGLVIGLTAVPTPANLSTAAAMTACTWTSSNEEVATVSGTGAVAAVTVLATGETDITAKVHDVTTTFHLKVVAADSGSDDPDNPVDPDDPDTSDQAISLLTATIPDIPSQVFVGLPLTPEVTVTYKGAELVEGTDYEVSYVNNDKHGIAGAVITGKGDYTGEVLRAFNVYSEVVDVFSDVSYSDWFVSSGALDYSYVHALVEGYSGDRAGQFGPYDLITRGQVATILWRIAGEPTDCDAADFDDVNYSNYYGPAVTWARATGVISGYEGTNDFGPNANVTREDLCCMLANYAEKIAGVDTSSDCAKLDSFPDSVTVQAYARESVGWCIDKGLMNGVRMDDGTEEGTAEVQAQGNAWRASMASMTTCLHRDVLKLG